MKSLTILYVEDYKLILLYVKEMLEAQGWHVETCQDGISALERIESGTFYDVLVLDNSLPGISGLELVRRARSLTHRRRTLIIMLSANDAERAAIQAGANAFLKKPDEVEAIADTITRLIGLR
jgi:CheY-like chemotaxis protein